uniref:Uncharacterized protein n=1 Tax=Solanum lycopersicum TaxID=4081 RepID=A0A3Q7H4T9_SOLLC
MLGCRLPISKAGKYRVGIVKLTLEQLFDCIEILLLLADYVPKWALLLNKIIFGYMQVAKVE